MLMLTEIIIDVLESFYHAFKGLVDFFFVVVILTFYKINRVMVQGYVWNVHIFRTVKIGRAHV